MYLHFRAAHTVPFSEIEGRLFVLAREDVEKLLPVLKEKSEAAENFSYYFGLGQIDDSVDLLLLGTIDGELHDFYTAEALSYFIPWQLLHAIQVAAIYAEPILRFDPLFELALARSRSRLPRQATREDSSLDEYRLLHTPDSFLAVFDSDGQSGLVVVGQLELLDGGLYSGVFMASENKFCPYKKGDKLYLSKKDKITSDTEAYSAAFKVLESSVSKQLLESCSKAVNRVHFVEGEALTCYIGHCAKCSYREVLHLGQESWSDRKKQRIEAEMRCGIWGAEIYAFLLAHKEVEAFFTRARYRCPVCGGIELRQQLILSGAGVTIERKVYCHHCAARMAQIASKPTEERISCPNCTAGLYHTGSTNAFLFEADSADSLVKRRPDFLAEDFELYSFKEFRHSERRAAELAGIVLAEMQ